MHPTGALDLPRCGRDPKEKQGQLGLVESVPGLRRAPRPALSTLGCVELSSLPTQCQHVLGSGGNKLASRASCVERCSFRQEATEAGGSNRDSWCPPTYATSSWALSWPTRSLASRHGHRTQCRPAGFQAQPHDILSPSPASPARSPTPRSA